MAHCTFHASNDKKTGTDVRAGDKNCLHFLHSCIFTPPEKLSCRAIAVSQIVSLTLCNLLLGFRLRAFCHLKPVCWFSFPPDCHSHRLVTLGYTHTHARTYTHTNRFFSFSRLMAVNLQVRLDIL
jgi:hypothetical protein